VDKIKTLIKETNTYSFNKLGQQILGRGREVVEEALLENMSLKQRSEGDKVI
jgi:hypothetical protein